MANAFPKRRDSKHRILRRGESVREDGLYQFKYHVNGKPKFVYSWRLEPTDKVPQGKKPGPSLRELEKQIGYDLDAQMDPTKKSMTVLELVGRYLATKLSVRFKLLEAGGFWRQEDQRSENVRCKTLPDQDASGGQGLQQRQNSERRTAAGIPDGGR